MISAEIGNESGKLVPRDQARLFGVDHEIALGSHAGQNKGRTSISPTYRRCLPEDAVMPHFAPAREPVTAASVLTLIQAIERHHAGAPAALAFRCCAGGRTSRKLAAWLCSPTF